MMRTDALVRTAALLGEDAMRRLEAAHVMVIGLGGVGGHAAMALARSGVGRLTLVDKDRVSASNLNRQEVAAISTLGMQKCDALAARIADVSPWVQTTPVCTTYAPGCALEFERADMVLDCVDDLRAKVDIISRCQQGGVRVLSCMGTAMRLDPSRVTCMDVFQTCGDGLARRMRSLLRKAGIARQTVVCSTEAPRKAGDRDAKALCSSAFVPAAAGLLLASLAVQTIALRVDP